MRLGLFETEFLVLLLCLQGWLADPQAGCAAEPEPCRAAGCTCVSAGPDQAGLGLAAGGGGGGLNVLLETIFCVKDDEAHCAHVHAQRSSCISKAGGVGVASLFLLFGCWQGSFSAGL
jgi:hypothetical protein